MKKLNIIISAACITSFMFASCKKVLEKGDISSFTASQVYNDSTTAVLSVNYLYGQNQPGWFGSTGGSVSSNLAGLTEELYSDNAFVKGTVTAETVTDFGGTTSGNYTKIRQLNQFIQDINAGTLATPVKNRFLAQALFWRAYRYFDLVRLYGGVPLVLTPLAEVGPDNRAADNLPRNKTSEVFTQIVKDLDTCIKYIPVKWPQNGDYGRITKGAATAFLGRVLLTYASPQFNSTNDASRWQAAYDANTSAISILSGNGFGLYSKWDYTMWTTDGSGGGSTPLNPEAVLVTGYNTSQSSDGTYPETYDNNSHPKYLAANNGGGSNTPTYDLTLAFPMLDGKAPGVSTKYPYTLQTFYKNRDPRFDQTIAYNGCLWPLLGNTSYRLWTYYYYTDAKGTVNKSTESSASTTGFYLRKGINPTLTLTSLQYAGTDWIEIRYAEVLLNQAEAAAELGKTQEAYNNLIALRKRAGLEAGTDGLYGLAAGMSHDQMISAIMLERQIEQAFEGKRYWDLRRRNLLESTLNGKTRLGMFVALKQTNAGTSTASTTDYILNTRDASVASSSLDAVYSANFTVTTKVLDTYKISYQTADRFFGIPTAALTNNKALQQNNTWGGPFDPLQ